MKKFNLKNVVINEAVKEYNRLGYELSHENEKVFAKYLEITQTEDKRKYYWIATYNNSPYDTQGPESHRESNLDIKLTKTNKESFNYYLQYLRSKNCIYFTKANRSFINNA